MGDVYFTLASIHNTAYQSLAVLLIVQLIKGLPLIKRLPSQWLAVFIGEMLVFLTDWKSPATVTDVVILVLNGLLAGAAAIGGWHVIDNAITTIKNQ